MNVEMRRSPARESFEEKSARGSSLSDWRKRFHAPRLFGPSRDTTQHRHKLLQIVTGQFVGIADVNFSIGAGGKIPILAANLSATQLDIFFGRR